MTDKKTTLSICQLSEINVVGNAESLLSQDYASQIDSLPTLRFNYINLKPAHGTRWDYLATSQINLVQKYKDPQWHTILYTRWRNADDKHFANLPYPVEEISTNLMHEFNKKIKRPSTGLSALMYLDTLNIKCNIFGFDWKKTPSFYQDEATEKRANSPHNYQLEERLALELIEKNKWVLYT